MRPEPMIFGLWPNITGRVGCNAGGIYTGAFSYSDGDGWTFANRGGGGFNFDASLSNSIYSASETVQPNAVQTLIIIKI